MSCRLIMSSFEAALRVIVAARAIRIVQVQLVGICRPMLDIKAFPLTDAWAQRRFSVCLSPSRVCRTIHRGEENLRKGAAV